MSEGEVTALKRDIHELSVKADRQHQENRISQEKDREAFRLALATQQQTFAASMEQNRVIFQEALNKQSEAHTELDKKVSKMAVQLEAAVGDGQPGSGRLGVLETAVEVLKKFRWQALSAFALLMYLAELYRDTHAH